MDEPAGLSPNNLFLFRQMQEREKQMRASGMTAEALKLVAEMADLKRIQDSREALWAIPPGADSTNPLPGAPNEGHPEGGAKTRALYEWTDAEIEETRQTALRAARVHRVLDEAARGSRAIDSLFASDEPPTRRKELAPPTAAPAPTANPAPAVAPKTHKTKRRADRLAAVLTVAKRQALDPADWQSIWAALVKLAEPVSRPAPLLGYVEGEGVQYRTDDSEQPVAYLTRNAFRRRFGRS